MICGQPEDFSAQKVFGIIVMSLIFFKCDFRSDRTCYLDTDGRNAKCECLPGYEGKRCERCAEGYRGNPMLGEECIPYDQCDRSGSLSSELNPYTRRCECKVKHKSKFSEVIFLIR